MDGWMFSFKPCGISEAAPSCGCGSPLNRHFYTKHKKKKNQDSDLALPLPPLLITHSPSHLLSFPSSCILLLTSALSA